MDSVDKGILIRVYSVNCLLIMLLDLVNFIEYGTELPESATNFSQPEKANLPLDKLLDWALKDLNPYGLDDFPQSDPSALGVWRE